MLTKKTLEERLSVFTGADPGTVGLLLHAFAEELTRFQSVITAGPDEAGFKAFRESAHTIWPSLEILQLKNLMAAINRYKTAYRQAEELTLPAAETKVFVKEILGLLNN